MKEYIFDDRNSIIHFALGTITPFTKLLGVLIFLSFLIYETLEIENPVSTLGDFIEYVMGFLFGILLMLILTTYAL